MEDWRFGPPVLIGERVVWLKNSDRPSERGVVRWIGKLSKEAVGWTVGVELDNPLQFGSTDGSWGVRRLFQCDPSRGVFLPLTRIRKELNATNENENSSRIPNNQEANNDSVDEDENERREGLKSNMINKKCVYDPPTWINNLNSNFHDYEDSSTDTDHLKYEPQITNKLIRSRKKPNRLSRTQECYKIDSKRRLSVRGINENDKQSGVNSKKKPKSFALEEQLIHELIQREMQKGKRFPVGQKKFVENINDVKGNFKRIDEDDISTYECNDTSQSKNVTNLPSRTSWKAVALCRREKSGSFFSFLKWFKRSKEMPDLDAGKDSSVTSSPSFIRRRSPSCGSVDTLFSIATAKSFAFVPPVQYQAAMSSSPTAPPASPNSQKVEDEAKRSQSDYENNNPLPVKSDNGNTSDLRKRKKSRAPGPPAEIRDISLPNTLEYKRLNGQCKAEERGCHRRSASESLKDKKAGFYCHVQGKRKAPLPPPATPLYPSLSNLKSQCPSLGKKKRPAPQPPEQASTASGFNEAKIGATAVGCSIVPYLNPKRGEIHSSEREKGILESKSSLFPLHGLAGSNFSSSPLPSRPWYKRNSSGSNILMKESMNKKKNQENENWMPEVGFSRRRISNESTYNLFNLLSRVDRNPEKKKEEKRNSQISILTNISELDREAAEIVRRERQKKFMHDSKTYIFENCDQNVLSSVPNDGDDSATNNDAEKSRESPKRATRNSFDEYKVRPKREFNLKLISKEKASLEATATKYDANSEIDYYINPWNCPKCTFQNPGWGKFCEACNLVRVKFGEDTKKNLSSPPESKKFGETKLTEEMPNCHLLKESKREGPSPSEKMVEPPVEDLEGVRRKRLAFFESGLNNIHNSVTPLSPASEAEKLKLKIMVKEIKNSVPKREKGVINNMGDTGGKDDASEINDSPKADILRFPDDAHGKTSTKEFSNEKVQPTWPVISNDVDNHGASEKVKQGKETSVTAEAIILTQTTVFEDVIVKNSGKMQKAPQANSERNIQLKGENNQKKRNGIQTNANVQNIKESSDIMDLSPIQNPFDDRDTEVRAAELQREGAGSSKYDVNNRAMSFAAEKNTTDANRLLRRLEDAINTGQHLDAAMIAKDLARMKINCSVKGQTLHLNDEARSEIVVDLFVEDKLTQKGPIQIKILPTVTLAHLKAKVEKEWDIPQNVQRWIIGKELAADDVKTLEQYGVIDNSSPLFLYLVTQEEQPVNKKGNFDGLKRLEKLLEVDEVSESHSEATNTSSAVEENENISKNLAPDPKENHLKKHTSSTSGPEKKELLKKRSSRVSTSFERRDMPENLKKELKVVSANSVKDRIEKLNRAASSKSTEATESQRLARNHKHGKKASTQNWHYNELMQLENVDLVVNAEPFECPVCLTGYEQGDGIVLKDCLHIFCRTCLVNAIEFNDEAEVKCPYRDNDYSCESVLQQREIKSLVPRGLFEQHLAKSVSVAENAIRNAYHCKTPDCRGWCILEDNVNEFWCPVCKKVNCLTCQAIHTELNCRQYQEHIQLASDTNIEAKKTKDMLQEMVGKGEAMNCPTCQVVLMKKWGCDWLRCSMCKTEICWVTKGPRWGLGGKGDTSGGCQCGVNGIKCHPKCNYCH